MAEADAGDMIVAGVTAVIALLLSMGLAGVPFVDWLGVLLLFVHGVLLMQGRLGANGTIGGLYLILAPAYLIIPPFLPAIGIIVQIITVVGLWILVPLKLFRLW